MAQTAESYIAGWKTPADWYSSRDSLTVGSHEGWHEAFVDFFYTRLETRYLRPIQVLQENGTLAGEGFSILAIQCSLIEFLESTATGTSYRFLRRGDRLGPFEYSSSQAMFVAFLRDRIPFAHTFNEIAAQDFYVSVRCGLLHEARTKNGWRIWADSLEGKIADTKARIVYRNNFHAALLEYIANFGERLPMETTLQEAFIRKFDGLCS